MIMIPLCYVTYILTVLKRAKKSDMVKNIVSEKER